MGTTTTVSVEPCRIMAPDSFAALWLFEKRFELCHFYKTSFIRESAPTSATNDPPPSALSRFSPVVQRGQNCTTVPVGFSPLCLFQPSADATPVSKLGVFLERRFRKQNEHKRKSCVLRIISIFISRISALLSVSIYFLADFAVIAEKQQNFTSNESSWACPYKYIPKIKVR